MCIGGGGGAPAPPARIPEAPITPAASTGVGASTEDRRRRRAAGGDTTGTGTGTLLTGPRGIQDGTPTVGKTLLGQ